MTADGKYPENFLLIPVVQLSDPGILSHEAIETGLGPLDQFLA
jgi:hypothetical protein